MDRSEWNAAVEPLFDQLREKAPHVGFMVATYDGDRPDAIQVFSKRAHLRREPPAALFDLAVCAAAAVGLARLNAAVLASWSDWRRPDVTEQRMEIVAHKEAHALILESLLVVLDDATDPFARDVLLDARHYRRVKLEEVTDEHPARCDCRDCADRDRDDPLWRSAKLFQAAEGWRGA